MAMKVFLIELCVTIPIVAEDSESAIDFLPNNPEVACDAVQQQLENFLDGDESDIVLGAHELRAEDITGADADWSDAVPFGDDSDATIAERLLDDADENEPPQDQLWGEPDHVDD